MASIFSFSFTSDMTNGRVSHTLSAVTDSANDRLMDVNFASSALRCCTSSLSGPSALASTCSIWVLFSASCCCSRALSSSSLASLACVAVRHSRTGWVVFSSSLMVCFSWFTRCLVPCSRWARDSLKVAIFSIRAVSWSEARKQMAASAHTIWSQLLYSDSVIGRSISSEINYFLLG
uniref:(northern house mosquito) hypothetical protein n=1 Tax=Culex pipiens TaxID=7175 RepID=A0A8D8FV72_CULPI